MIAARTGGFREADHIAWWTEGDEVLWTCEGCETLLGGEALPPVREAICLGCRERRGDAFTAPLVLDVGVSLNEQLLEECAMLLRLIQFERVVEIANGRQATCVSCHEPHTCKESCKLQNMVKIVEGEK